MSEQGIEYRASRVSLVTGTSTALSIVFQIISVPVCLRDWGQETYGSWMALFAAFMQTARVTAIDVSRPDIMAGLLVGAMLPFVFSALSMNAVGRAAMAMIEEVRRQFRDIPELNKALAVKRKYDSDMTKATVEDRAIFDAADGKAEYD